MFSTTHSSSISDLNSSTKSPSPQTFGEILRLRAETTPDKTAYFFLGDGEQITEQITYAELYQRAKWIAAELQHSVLPGDRVVLFYPPGLDYILAFLACLISRQAIAVPAYPPRKNRPSERLKSILDDCQPALILTTKDIYGNLEEWHQQMPQTQDCQWFQTDLLLERMAQGQAPLDYQPVYIFPDQIAFLQYTSGSTSTPKGVMVSHGNLIANEAAIQIGFGHDVHSNSVSWLPLFHDMGLIWGGLHSLYLGTTGTLMPPNAFLQKPLNWLKAISQTKAHTSGAPNFAYDLCVQKISEADLALLDLSHWQIAFNGAEPIHPETIEAFSQKFAVCGFKKEAFYPCYGLAEATLFVTGGQKQIMPLLKRVEYQVCSEEVQSQESHQKTLVGSGQAVECTIQIVNPHSLQVCAPSEEGEIWVSSESIAQGYWKNPSATQEIFQAQLAEFPGKTFMRTGDLGVLESGELFVTGRLKDLIILRGKNLYPQDIERTVEKSHPSLIGYSSAAFSVVQGATEVLVVVSEVSRHFKQLPVEDIVQSIRQSILKNYEVDPGFVVLIKPASLPKTSSGKIQRSLCRRLFEENQLAIVYQWERPLHQETTSWILDRDSLLALSEEEQLAHLEAFLRESMQRFLGADSQGSSDWSELSPMKRMMVQCQLQLQLGASSGGLFDQFQLDSLQAAELQESIESKLQVQIPLEILFAQKDLAAAARSLLELILKADEPHASREEPFIPSAISEFPILISGEKIPLSFEQEGLWFLNQLYPHDRSYHLAGMLWFKGNLQIETLHQSLLQVVQRHDILRTVFLAEEGRVFQQIQPSAFLEMPLVDLQNVPAKDRKTQAMEEAIALGRTPFDWSRPPLIKACLFHLDEFHYGLSLTIHHLIFDELSVNPFFWEIQEIYTALSQGKPITLSPPTGSFAHFAKAQRQGISEGPQKSLAYWKQELAGELPIIELPLDHPRKNQPSTEGGRVSFQLHSLTQSIKTFTQKHSVTPYMLLLSVFKTVLRRYCSQSTILVGTPVTYRNRSALRNLIGFFANTMVIRSDFRDEMSFEDLLMQVKQKVLESLQHQELSFNRLVSEISPPRHSGIHPIFQVMFSLETYAPEWIFENEALSMTYEPVDLGGSKFDLTLGVHLRDEVIDACFEYNASLFEETTIQRMVGHFQVVLNAVLENPTQSIATMPLLTPEETHQLLVEWNNTEAPYPKEKCIHQLIEEQVSRTPEATALIFQDQEMSYRELNQKANQLAHYLMSQGIGPEVLVGICVERSFEMIIGILGILKAGGAYVPLDPEYPAERLKLMVEDTQTPLVLTQSHLLEKQPFLQNTTTFCLDSPANQLADLPIENPQSGVQPENLVYVIYTSGSTGKPKGVMIEHKSLVNHMFWMEKRWNWNSEDRVLQKTSISFDASVWEIFLPLIRGFPMVLLGPQKHRDPVAIIDSIDHDRITILQVVPTMLEQLSYFIKEKKSLKYLFSGGEPLFSNLANRVLNELDAILVNLYGPAEVTIDAAYHVVQPIFSAVSVPIGNPIANLQFYILDHRYQVVPQGVIGEIYISGDGVGRGYLNLPEETLLRWIKIPLIKGEKFYKTGDYARYLSEGRIEFLGRHDHQIKINGSRIEISEIELALSEHPLIKKVAVLSKGTHLSAYIVGHPISNQEIRFFLKKKLPSFMVPREFLFFDELPVTPAGKIDRISLASMTSLVNLRTVPEQSFQTENEKILGSIWGELLNLVYIDRKDNFFELGGDSILAIQMVIMAANQGLDLKIDQIFELGFLDQIAQTVNAFEDEGEKLPLSDGVIPLAPMQEWFFEQNFKHPHVQNQTICLSFKQELIPEIFKKSFDFLLKKHPSLRTQFQSINGKWVQYIPENLPHDITSYFSFYDLSTASDAESSFIEITSTIHQSFDICTGPLCHLALFSMPDSYWVFFPVHHLNADVVSFRILLAELMDCYELIKRNDPLPMDYRSTSFEKWAQSIHEKPIGEKVLLDLDYWKSVTNHQSSILPGEKTESIPLKNLNTTEFFPNISLKKLRQTCQSLDSTIEAFLLSLVLMSIYRWTGHSAVFIDVEHHGRLSHFTVDRTVGWFATIFPILFEMTSINSFEHLQQVQAFYRKIPQLGFSFSVLRYSTMQLPKFKSPKICFNYLGDMDSLFLRNHGVTLVERFSELYQLKDEMSNYLMVIYVYSINNKIKFRITHPKYMNSSINFFKNELIHQFENLFMSEVSE